MLAKLSVDQALKKAKSHIKKNEVIEAKKLYQVILKTFPKNLRAHQGLTALKKTCQNNTSQSVPQETIDLLVNLCKQGNFLTVIEQAQVLKTEYPKAFMVWYILGVSIAQTGKLAEAVEAFKKAISLRPDYAVTYNNMGNVLEVQGKFDEAIEAFKKSIALKPDYADAYNNMGLTLQFQGKPDKAIEAFNKSIALKPDNAYGYNNIGLILKDQSKLEEAIEAFKKSISVKPDYADAYNNMGLTLKDQGKLDKAIEAFKKSILLRPDYAYAYNNMGLTLKDQGKLEEAIEAYKKAISLRPNNAVIYNNMGDVLQVQGKLNEAIEAFNKSIALKPDLAEAYSNMGLTLKDLGKLEEAIEVYDKAIALKPNNAVIYNNFGNVLQFQGKPDEAIEAFNKSIALKPDLADAHKNLSLTLIKSGKLKEGLDKYEWRWRTKKFLLQQRHFSQPLWDGKKSLKGKSILLWCEQGVGDTIMWVSKIESLKLQCKHCIVECQEKLVPLLKRSFPNVEVKTQDRSRDTERDDFDYHLPMGSLYKHFLDEIIKNPKPDAYLVADPDRVNFWKERLSSLGNGPYIGICWKSAHSHIERRPNYATISELYPILKLPNVTYVNLQYTDFTNDLITNKKELGVTVHNFNDLDQWNNIDDVAALCSALDMVVSTKTTVPLISAAVGTSTKLANWKQSYWNNILHNAVGPSVDTFERNTWESWDNVFNSIAEDILKFKRKRAANG